MVQMTAFIRRYLINMQISQSIHIYFQFFHLEHKNGELLTLLSLTAMNDEGNSCQLHNLQFFRISVK